MEPNPSDIVLSDRIQTIVNTEKSIDEMMKCAREIIQDLGKEKQIGKNKMEENANTFKKLITQVENELSSQMQYLSHVCVGSSHQGSTFGVLQNSLLAQSGLASLHSELAHILTTVDPKQDVVSNGEGDEEEEDGDEEEEEGAGEGLNLDNAQEDVVAPLTTSSTGTASTSEEGSGGSGGAQEDDGAGSSAPRSQEETGRRSTEDEEEETMQH
ncbi:CRE-MDT-11 protein [Caenorhabditis remanei]|uniref:Mediator of RNA polymerase II transcription subunit 11 n=1 Tax=Caenorhabditis remanei TaxID=31234 RepID=E3LSP3_CAERE|nr:CRE-MDT-11 protein [Caenorhabditis remanei]